MRTTTFTIRGLTGLIMHNGQLADPLNQHTKLLKKLADKKNKTDADHDALARVEFMGSLYVDDTGHPCLPGEVLEAALAEGARRMKLGKVVKGGVVIDGNFRLTYDGPKDPDKLWSNGGFKKRAGVRVKQQRIIRTRPLFPRWECTFEVQWDPSMIKDEDQLNDIVDSAGSTGIGDWRPKFGRFEVVS